MLEVGILVFGPVEGQSSVCAARKIGAGGAHRAKVASNAAEYFRACRGREQLLVNHLVQNGGDGVDRKRSCNSKLHPQFEQVRLQIVDALTLGKHVSSPVAAPVATVAEAAGESILGGGGHA